VCSISAVRAISERSTGMKTASSVLLGELAQELAIIPEFARELRLNRLQPCDFLSDFGLKLEMRLIYD
jgi:hypothetical protein